MVHHDGINLKLSQSLLCGHVNSVENYVSNSVSNSAENSALCRRASSSIEAFFHTGESVVQEESSENSCGIKVGNRQNTEASRATPIPSYL